MKPLFNIAKIDYIKQSNLVEQILIPFFYFNKLWIIFGCCQIFAIHPLYILQYKYLVVKEADSTPCHPDWAGPNGVLDYNTSPERYMLKIKPNTIAVDPKLALSGSNDFLSFGGENYLQTNIKARPLQFYQAVSIAKQ